MYDRECHKLAVRFLGERSKLLDRAHANTLAQNIQDAIESYLAWMDEQSRKPNPQVDLATVKE